MAALGTPTEARRARRLPDQFVPIVKWNLRIEALDRGREAWLWMSTPFFGSGRSHLGHRAPCRKEFGDPKHATCAAAKVTQMSALTAPRW